jgi:hypothetical protein
VASQIHIKKDSCEKYCKKGLEELPAADFSSYAGTMKAGLAPSKTFDTVDDITDANIIIAVVNGGEFSALRGLNTVSMAKKHPATAALKPENPHNSSSILALKKGIVEL